MQAQALEVFPCALVEIKKFVEENHYSRSVNGVKIRQCFKVVCAGQLVGGVIFGQLSTTAWKRFATNESDVLELRRLVLKDEAERNSETWVIARCLRWIKRYLPQVKVIVSYADPAFGHVGTIYRAANFAYLGITKGDVAFRDV